MLLELNITNYALIDSLHLEFEPGFTILTGETGAGKSILIGALSLLLGERASSDSVRNGANSASVQGVFTLPLEPEVTKILADLGIETDDDTLLIRRDVMANGRSRAMINGMLVNLNNLQQIGNFLVDWHGQHDHQSLFRADSHRQILDAFGQIDPAQFQESYNNLNSLVTQFQKLRKQQQDCQDKLELFTFQLNEIESLDPAPDEIDGLEAELIILDNAEKLLGFADLGNKILKDDVESVSDRLGYLVRQGENLGQIDPRLQPILQQLNSALIEIEDAANGLAGYAHDIDYDPQRAAMIRERVDELNRLSRKYGGSLTAVIEKRDFLKKQLDLIENSDFELSALEKEITQTRINLSKLAIELSEKRQKAAQEMNRKVEIQLNDLGMERTRFEVSLTVPPDKNGLVEIDNERIETSEFGIDQVEFLISPNLGEDLKPLTKIASGGEISRLMLALKTVLADAVPVPTLIFDEADAGIGGRIAEMVGHKMADLASQRQVLCITHIPLIAALGDTHLHVVKLEKEGRTITQTRHLTPKDREDEIARMLGGQEITDVTRKHARELLLKRKKPTTGAQAQLGF